MATASVFVILTLSFGVAIGTSLRWDIFGRDTVYIEKSGDFVTAGKSNVYMIKEHDSDVHSGPTGNYKIGFSASPDKRIGDLRGGNSRSLDFQHKSQVRSVQAAKDAEKEIHQELDKYRIKNRAMAGTEWFYVDSNHFHDFEQTYIKIANKYKSEWLNDLDEPGFLQYSLEEAAKENEKAIDE